MDTTSTDTTSTDTTSTDTTSTRRAIARRIATAVGLAAAFAIGVTVPSGAAPSTDGTSTAAITERGDTLLAARGVQKRSGDLEGTERLERTEAPAQTEGIAGGFVFVAITPYRTLDSRNYVDGFMFGGDEVVFSVLVDEFNVPRIPNTAVAVTYNLTVDGTVGAGFCAAFPGPALWPGNSSINWTGSRQTIANGGVAGIGRLDEDGQISIYCGPTSRSIGTDFILDITGYYF